MARKPQLANSCRNPPPPLPVTPHMIHNSQLECRSEHIPSIQGLETIKCVIITKTRKFFNHVHVQKSGFTKFSVFLKRVSLLNPRVRTNFVAFPLERTARRSLKVRFDFGPRPGFSKQLFGSSWEGTELDWTCFKQFLKTLCIQLERDREHEIRRIKCLRGFPKSPKIEKIQSRLKFSISLEIFNPDLQNSPQNIVVGGSLEMFNLA